MELKFDTNGLIPAVCQDASNGEVLMVAWMNAEALHLTQTTGEAHFETKICSAGRTEFKSVTVDEIRGKFADRSGNKKPIRGA